MTGDPLHQADLETLEAELRQAKQLRDAALQRAQEAGCELQRAIENARVILARMREASGEAGSKGAT